ncbi:MULTISPECIES: ribonuclease domain-containing protein [Psychrobacter]|jgi:ribonuclease T1|uniref:ribonuclease domain-containing protein n=1 Tax=Psychrobacter TaxID=497 RepID=UPI0004283D49|nr:MULTISPECIES: ribonuclease domain-containing protein [Psychrobacter]PKG35116.1 DNA-binding protein [Psychrobacter sp. Sarcosine-3u-12]
MQSGKIKHWNQDKGYGFIDVDNQNEDVFFHVSTVRLSQPISEGQRVYFHSQRNDKNQLRATEVTSNDLSILETSDITPAARSSNNTERDRQQHKRHTTQNNNVKKSRGHQKKKSPLSTLFSLIAIIAVAVYFFADLKSTLLADNAQSTPISQTSSIAAGQAQTSAITGDAQIDTTIALIKQGGPFPYPNKDGTTFYNREGLLPAQSQGYYHEYTVPTPGVSHRGARRIVTGGNPPTIYYLTVDHYDSFSKLEVN